MTEEKTKTEYPKIKELKDGEWYQCWLGNITTNENKFSGGTDAVWNFVICNEIEGQEQRQWINWWNTSLNLPRKGKESKLYHTTSKGEASKLKKVLTALQAEDDVLRTFGGASLEPEVIRKAIKETLKTKTLMVKISVVNKNGKVYCNSKDVKMDPTPAVKMAEAIDKQQEKAPSKLKKKAVG